MAKKEVSRDLILKVLCEHAIAADVVSAAESEGLNSLDCLTYDNLNVLAKLFDYELTYDDWGDVEEIKDKETGETYRSLSSPTYKEVLRGAGEHE